MSRPRQLEHFRGLPWIILAQTVGFLRRKAAGLRRETTDDQQVLAAVTAPTVGDEPAVPDAFVGALAS